MKDVFGYTGPWKILIVKDVATNEEGGTSFYDVTYKCETLEEAQAFLDGIKFMKKVQEQ
jgi:hypothetical protein